MLRKFLSSIFFKKTVPSDIQKVNNIKRLIEIIEIVIGKINPSTDVLWAGYDTPQELKRELIEDLGKLKSGEMEALDKFKAHFLPTTTFQELSLSNGWGREYLKLADEFDKLYSVIKDKKSQSNNSGFF